MSIQRVLSVVVQRIGQVVNVQRKCHLMKTKLILTMKEQHKLKMVIDYETKKIIARTVADLPGISVCHFLRLVAAYRERGVAALAHGNCGKSPANRISDDIRQ